MNRIARLALRLFAKLAAVKIDRNERNPNEIARVILDIARELFRCYTWVLPSSQTVRASRCGATSRNQLESVVQVQLLLPVRLQAVRAAGNRLSAPRKGADGRRIRPSTFPEHRFGPLRFVPRQSDLDPPALSPPLAFKHASEGGGRPYYLASAV
jgi:hypothetical protein